jgi:hypothetical protein
MAYLEKSLHIDSSRSQWLDGFNYQVLLRQTAIKPLYQLALSRCEHVVAGKTV